MPLSVSDSNISFLLTGNLCTVAKISMMSPIVTKLCANQRLTGWLNKGFICLVVGNLEFQKKFDVNALGNMALN